jgi:hypothetical protein
MKVFSLPGSAEEFMKILFDFWSFLQHERGVRIIGYVVLENTFMGSPRRTTSPSRWVDSNPTWSAGSSTNRSGLARTNRSNAQAEPAG